MFNTRRSLAFRVAAHAEIAKIGEKGHVIDLHFAILQMVFIFSYFDAVLTHREVVFLLAGDLAGVAARAKIIVN